jgi:ankyrin repeat protein
MTSQEPTNAIGCRQDHGREPVADFVPVFSDLAKRLLQEGFISDGSDRINKTEALLWAVEHNHIPLVKELIADGADVNLPAADGWTCLGVSAQLPSPEILNILLRNGADVAAFCGMEGHTALHRAAEGRRSQAVRILISHGSKIDARTSRGTYPLHQAADKGCIETIQALLEAGASLQCADDEGWTSLHAACQAGHINALQLLVDWGASITSRTTDGCTPLHAAAIAGKHEIV